MFSKKNSNVVDTDFTPVQPDTIERKSAVSDEAIRSDSKGHDTPTSEVARSNTSESQSPYARLFKRSLKESKSESDLSRISAHEETIKNIRNRKLTDSPLFLSKKPGSSLRTQSENTAKDVSTTANNSI